MDWILNLKSYRNTKMGDIYVGLSGKLLKEYQAMNAVDKGALEELLTYTETFDYQDLSNFAKNMTISIISSDKDKFLKGQPGHGSQMSFDSTNQDNQLMIDGVEYFKIPFQQE